MFIYSLIGVRMYRTKYHELLISNTIRDPIKYLSILHKQSIEMNCLYNLSFTDFEQNLKSKILQSYFSNNYYHYFGNKV